MKNALSGTSLLVVDDDPDALGLLEFATTRAGATVRAASNPQEALVALTSFKPDVMLLDISLPEMDGYDLLKAIRRDPATRKVPAIAVTARVDERDKQRAAETGFSLHVSKPIDPEALVYLVATLKQQADASDPPTLRDFRAVLRALGARRSLEFLNRRTPYRFTGIYEFDGGSRRNVDLFDRLDPTATRGETTPLGETFCAFVEASCQPLIVIDASTDPRSTEPLRRAGVQSYCGVLLRRLDGTRFGSLCHWDLVPARPTPGSLDMLLHAAPLLAATIGDADVATAEGHRGLDDPWPVTTGSRTHAPGASSPIPLTAETASGCSYPLAQSSHLDNSGRMGPADRGKSGDAAAGQGGAGSGADSQLLRDANEELVLSTLRIQERLEDADAFRLLVESVEDYAIFRLDSEGRVASWNAGAQRVYGYGAEDIVGQPFAALYYSASGDASGSVRDLTAAREAGRLESEGMRRRKDGSTFWSTVIVAALHEDGRHVGFATATRDMTEHLRAEQERVRLARAEESERRKDEFLAIMGHELRNPLAPMLTALELITLRGGRHCESELGVLDRQLRHMMRLVDDLVDVARTVRDRVDFDPQVVDIGQVIANAIEVASPLIESKRHRLTVESRAAGLLVNVDPGRMSQVFVNLLINAAKYTNDGGDIRVTCARRHQQVEVTIEDTGNGIDPELMPRIFELFTQGEQGIERQLGGLGVGLGIARRLVLQHGGEITGSSEGLGRGSRFTVCLPRAAAGALSEPPPPPPLPQPAIGKRVLIVDDNDDATAMMSTLLQGSGHETRVAADGVRALEIAHEFQPNIVFLDIGLPGLDGFQVARRLRKIAACEEIPIVAVTGYSRESDRQRAFQSGFSEHFAKPIDARALVRAVEMAPAP